MIEFIDVIQKHWAIVMTIAGLAMAAVRLSMDSKYIKHDDLHKLRTNVYDHRERINSLETKVDSMPSASEVADIKVLMTEIKGETKAINAEMKGLGHQVGLLVAKEINKNE